MGVRESLSKKPLSMSRARSAAGRDRPEERRLYEREGEREVQVRVGREPGHAARPRRGRRVYGEEHHREQQRRDDDRRLPQRPQRRAARQRSRPASGTRSPSRLRLLGAVRLSLLSPRPLQRAAGLLQEDVVEARLVQPEVRTSGPPRPGRAPRRRGLPRHGPAGAADGAPCRAGRGSPPRSARVRRPPRRVGEASPGVASTLGRPISAFSASGVSSATILPRSMIPTRSASTSASSRYCVVRKTVTPSSLASRLTSLHSALRLCGSRPVVGSSRKSICGSCTSASARSSLRFIPPE